MEAHNIKIIKRLVWKVKKKKRQINAEVKEKEVWAQNEKHSNHQDTGIQVDF